jgi:glycosyltransferase 2 family protein
MDVHREDVIVTTEKETLPARFLKLGTVLAALAGFSLLMALLIANGIDAILGMVVRMGWGLLAVALVRACTLAVAGIGWAALLKPFVAVRVGNCILLRWVRESINVLLPVAQVGGDFIGGRLLKLWGVGGGRAVASVLVDLTVQVSTQFVFTLIGLGALALTAGDSRTIRLVTVSLLISAPALLGFYLFQRVGLVRIAEALLPGLVRARPWISSEGIKELGTSLRASYGARPALSLSFAWHLGAWCLGVVEIWIALTCMGMHPDWGECLVLESLGQAVRSADFAIPGVMGVQEGGFLVIGGLYGIKPESSLGLSLVKRVPDFAIGVPGLVAWLLLEANNRSRVRAISR